MTHGVRKYYSEPKHNRQTEPNYNRYSGAKLQPLFGEQRNSLSGTITQALDTAKTQLLALQSQNSTTRKSRYEASEWKMEGETELDISFEPEAAPPHVVKQF